MANPETLDNLFAAYVAQGTLEEAVDMMASLATSYPDLGKEYLSVLNAGIVAAKNGDATVIAAINKSGYLAKDCIEAASYCEELLRLLKGRMNEHI